MYGVQTQRTTRRTLGILKLQLRQVELLSQLCMADELVFVCQVVGCSQTHL